MFYTGSEYGWSRLFKYKPVKGSRNTILKNMHSNAAGYLLTHFCYAMWLKRQYYYYYYNHFMALWTLSGTTRMSQYRKVHFAIFWIFWCKMKITQADAPTIQMD